MQFPAVGFPAFRCSWRGLAAAISLTAAAFLLPAPDAPSSAQAASGQIETVNIPAALR